MMNAFSLKAFDGFDLKGYHWQSVQEPIATLVLAHGMAENVERYAAFAEFLNTHHIDVIGIHQRGHGPHAEMLGYLGDNGWDAMKEDLRYVINSLKAEYENKPIILMGHSMGSFLVRDFLRSYSYLVDGVILSGTGFYSKMTLKLGKWLAERDVRAHGDKHISELVHKMAFESNNKKVKAPRTDLDWLTRDEKMVDDYINSPLCGQKHPSSFYALFFNGLEGVFFQDAEANFKAGLPMLIFSGDADPIGNYGKGVHQTAKYYKDHGYKVSLNLYKEGRHEMLNELNRAEVFEDVANWIVKQIG